SNDGGVCDAERSRKLMSFAARARACGAREGRRIEVDRMGQASWRSWAMGVVAVATFGCVKTAILNGQIKGTRDGSVAIDTLSDYEVARARACAGLGPFAG